MDAGKLLFVFSLLPIMETLSALPEFPLTNRELHIRAGYYSESGKYLGGLPESKHVDRLQLFECTGFNTDLSSSATNSATNTGDTATNAIVVLQANTTVCMDWTANDLGKEVFETGSCSCQSIANDEYCSAWSCNQLGVESTRCTCDADADVNDSGKFCASWSCVETNHDGTQEFGEYNCVSESSSADFCQAWTGIVEWSGEVDVSACECVEQWDGASVCSYWECNERNVEKCNHANSGWCNIGVSVGVGGSLGSLGAVVVALALFAVAKGKDSSEGMCYAAGGFVWMLGWSAGVVIWGGQDGAVYVGAWWGGIIACGLIYACLQLKPGRISRCYATYRARVT